MVTRVPTGRQTLVGPLGAGLKRGGRQADAADLNVVSPGRDPGVQIDDDAFGGAEARGVQSIASGLIAIANVQRGVEERRRNAEFNAFRMRHRSALNRKMFELFEESKASAATAEGFLTTVTPRFEQARAEILEELGAGFNFDDAMLAQLEADAIGLQERYSMEAVSFENNERVAGIAAQLDDTLSELERSVTIDGGVDDAIALFEESLDGFSGTLSPDILRKAKEKGRERLVEAGVLRAGDRIRDLGAVEAEALLEKIKDPDADIPLTDSATDIFNALDEASPRQLIAVQGTLRNVIEKHLAEFEQDQDDAVADAGDEAFKDGVELLAGGELTMDFIRENRDILSTTQFRQLVSAISREGASTSDPSVYADLLERADSDPTSIQDEALVAFANGQLTQSDLTSLFRIARQYEDNPPRGASKVRDFVRFSLKPNESFDISGRGARAQQEALLDFDMWLIENPDATFGEMRAQATRIVDEARGGAARFDIEVPRFVALPPEKITRKALEEAAQRTASALENGEITQQEAVRQSLLIQEWMQQVGDD